MSYIQWQEDQDYQQNAAYDYRSELWASEIESMKYEHLNDINQAHEEAKYNYANDAGWRSLVDALGLS